MPSQKFYDFPVSPLHNSTARGIMSAATGLGGISMHKRHTAAYFYFCYYYFFDRKK